MKQVILLAVLVVVGYTTLGRVFFMKDYNNNETTKSSQNYMTVEGYVSSNISVLSPIKESLGGKFYITKIEARNGVGTVEYEDGHSSYFADFKYSVNGDGKPEINSFIIRK